MRRWNEGRGQRLERRGKGQWPGGTHLGNESSLDDEGKVRESALTENLAVTEGKGVDNGDELSGLLGEVLLLVGGNHRPKLVDVDRGAEGRVSGQVEVSHTDLSEVSVRRKRGEGEVGQRMTSRTWLQTPPRATPADQTLLLPPLPVLRRPPEVAAAVGQRSHVQ